MNMHPLRFSGFPANRDIEDDSKQLIVAYNELQGHLFRLRGNGIGAPKMRENIQATVWTWSSAFRHPWKACCIELGGCFSWTKEISVQISNLVTADSPRIVCPSGCAIFPDRWGVVGNRSRTQTTVGEILAFARTFFVRGQFTEGTLPKLGRMVRRSTTLQTRKMRDFVNERSREKDLKMYPRVVARKAAGSGTAVARAGKRDGWNPSSNRSSPEPGPWDLRHDEMNAGRRLMITTWGLHRPAGSDVHPRPTTVCVTARVI